MNLDWITRGNEIYALYKSKHMSYSPKSTSLILRLAAYSSWHTSSSLNSLRSLQNNWIRICSNFKLQESYGNSTKRTMLIFHCCFEGSKKTQGSMQLRYAKANLSTYCLWSDWSQLSIGGIRHATAIHTERRKKNS